MIAKTQDDTKIFNNLLFKSRLWSKVVDCSAGAGNFAFSGPGGSFPTVAIGAASCTDGRWDGCWALFYVYGGSNIDHCFMPAFSNPCSIPALCLLSGLVFGADRERAP